MDIFSKRVERRSQRPQKKGYIKWRVDTPTWRMNQTQYPVLTAGADPSHFSASTKYEECHQDIRAKA